MKGGITIMTQTIEQLLNQAYENLEAVAKELKKEPNNLSTIARHLACEVADLEDYLPIARKEFQQ